MPRKNKPFSVLLIMRRIAVEVLGCTHQKIYQKKTTTTKKTNKGRRQHTPVLDQIQLLLIGLLPVLQ